ncbi:O-antigen ligase family protein [Priestia megaterium]
MKHIYAIIIAILLGCIVPFFLMLEKGMLLLIIPFIVILLVFIQIKKKIIKPEYFLFFLLASTAIPHSIISAGIKVSFSDIYLVIGFVSLLIINKFKFNFPKTYFSIAITYVVLSTLSLIWADEATKGISRLFQYFEFMIVTVFVFYNIKTTYYRKMLNWYVFISTILGIIAIIFYITQGGQGPVYMLGFHKNALGTVLGTSISLIMGLYLLSRQEQLGGKKIYLLCLIINMVGLVMSMSRGALIGSVAAIFILLFFMGKTKQIFILVPLLTICISLYLYLAPSYLERATAFDKFSSAYSRVTIYDDAVRKIKEHPLIGEGVGNYFIEIPMIHFSQDDPNNVFLLNLVELGLIGLVIFIVLLLCIFTYAIANNRKHKYNYEIRTMNAIFISGFVARLVHIQVDVSWVRGIGIFMFAMVGMMLALRKIDRIEKPNKSAI